MDVVANEHKHTTPQRKTYPNPSCYRGKMAVVLWMTFKYAQQYPQSKARPNPKSVYRGSCGKQELSGQASAHRERASNLTTTFGFSSLEPRTTKEIILCSLIWVLPRPLLRATTPHAPHPSHPRRRLATRTSLAALRPQLILQSASSLRDETPPRRKLNRFK